MTEREKSLLKAIVIEYIKDPHPVGSNAIVEKYLKDISSATIRNEMASLERLGYIEQPYTSAGRIPTTKAYEYYVENFLQERVLDRAEQHKLQRLFASNKGEYGTMMREMAKVMAELSGAAVIVGFSARDTYYTGLSNLFSQPEFAELDLVQNFSRIVDHLDEVLEGLFPQISDRVQILIGKHNPFGEECGALVTRCGSQRAARSLFGILGPIRMPYDRNRAILEYTRTLLSK